MTRRAATSFSEEEGELGWAKANWEARRRERKKDFMVTEREVKRFKRVWRSRKRVWCVDAEGEGRTARESEFSKEEPKRSKRVDP